MQNFKAIYFDGISSSKTECDIEIDGEFLYVDKLGLKLPLSEVEISSKISSISQTITLKDGSYFMVDQNACIQNSFVTKLESKSLYAIISLCILVGVVTFLLTIGSTFTAKYLAYALPKNTLDNLSHATLKQLDEYYLEPSKLDEKTKQIIKSNFQKIAPKDLNLKLHFYVSEELKANAFALPSGDIIMLDDLVKLDKDKHFRGITGVLAHEIGHVHHRHSMQNIIKTSIAGALMGYFLGDFSSIISVMATGVVSMQYSKKFEQQSDDMAILLLKKHDISIKPLANLFIKLKEKMKGKELPFLSTHPLFDERIKKFQNAFF